MKTPSPITTMSNSPRRPSAGFTLIELLTVIAIIGILASIIFPVVAGALTKVKRNVEGNNLRTIGQAALSAGNDNSDGILPDPLGPTGRSMTGGDGLRVWMGILARSGLNDPKLYLSKVDPKFPFPVEPPIVIIKVENKKEIDSKVMQITPAYEFVGGLRTIDPSTSPIGYTRGLKKDGEWDKDKSPYGDEMGFVVFMGGNLEKYTSIENKLTSVKGKATNNIAQCVPTNGNQRFYGINAVIGSPSGTSPDPAN